MRAISTEYNWEECRLYVIDRICRDIKRASICDALESREDYMRLSRILFVGYFRSKRYKALPTLEEQQEEWNRMLPDIERSIDGQMEMARRRILERTIISTSMKAVLEPRLNEAGLEYEVSYHKRSVDIKIRIGTNNLLDVNIKQNDLNASIDGLINTAKALRQLIATAGSNLSIPRV